jgi:hypothetical protein
MTISFNVEQASELTAGLEKYIPIQFYKQMHTFRIDQFSIIKSLSENKKFQLPDNSVLHLLDNITEDTVIDIPRFTHIRFPETYLRYIYHATDITPSGPLEHLYEPKYIYRTPGVTKNLMQFKSKYGSYFKYLQNLEMLPRRKESLTIVNYNVLFRMQIYGRLRTYRRINHILAAILNTVLSIPGNKRHFIHFPMTSAIYPRTTFIRSKRSLNIGAITYPDSPQWILLMHFLNFVDVTTKNSIFEYIPKDRLSDINFFFTTATDTDVYFNLYNLADLIRLNTRNRIYLKLYNHMCALSARVIDINISNELLNSTEEDTTMDIESVYTDTEHQSDTLTNAAISDDTDTITQIKKNTEPSTISELTDTLVYYTPKPMNKYTSIMVKPGEILKLYSPDRDIFDELLEIYQQDIYAVYIDTQKLNDKSYTNIDNSTYSPIEQYQKEGVIGYTQNISFRAISDIRKYQYTPSTSVINTQDSDQDSDIETPNIPKSVNTIKTAVKTPLPKNPITSSNTKEITPKIKSTQTVNTTSVKNITLIDHYTDMINTTLQKIETDTTMTPKQKERYRTMVRNVSQLKINGASIQEHLEKASDTELVPSSLVHEVDVPDKSAATSKLNSYSEIYNTKLFYADTAAVVTSFINQNMIPTEISEKSIRNELTNAVEYTVRYEEIGTSKKHTVKFTLPVIDSENVCLINGVRKKLKKQIINVPICKLSETRVSLVSNYNKSIVSRKISKNNNYLAYIVSLVLKGLELRVLTCEYGETIIPKPVSYEYATIAKKYRSITLLGNTNTSLKTVLCFDYDNRLKTLQVPENKYSVVLKLEEHFGILVGTVISKNMYMFINKDNIITTLTTGNTVVPDAPSSISECILNYFPNEAIGNVQQPVEYVNLKILDKEFPMGFILAYKMGLRPLLSYLKVPYKVIDKRSKKLIYTDETISEVDLQKQKYIPPLPLNKLPDNLKTHPIYKWKATTGIELIHETETYDEFQRIKSNWDAMTIDQKAISDQKCIELTGMSNIDYAEILEWKMRIKRIRYIPDLDILGLDQNEYIIIGTAAAIFYGYNEVNTSIDILVLPDTAKRLHQEGKIFQDTLDSYHYTNKQGTINVYTTYMSKPCSVTEFHKLQKNALHIDNTYTFIDEKTLLSMYNTLYQFHQKNEYKKIREYLSTRVDDSHLQVKYTPEPNTISIPFKDVILVINRYPLLHSFIIAGLTGYKTNNYYLEELDTKDIYFSILLDHKLKVNYLKGIDAFFELFIDPITKDVLTKMKEPTNITDLLIRAVEMLTDIHTIEPSSVANHRIREYEQFNAILYNELSRQYAAYMSTRSAGSTFTVNPDAVYQRIIMNQSFTITEDINPIHNLKEKTAITYSGFGGRTSDSFVVDDRRYPKDAVGVISEATVDNGKVAINAQLSVAPNLVDARGMIAPPNERDMNPGNILAPAALLMPAADRDDSKRLNFISIQTSHMMPPVKDSGLCRLRTGYERILPYQCSSLYVGIAKRNGIVQDIDYTTKMVKVVYDDNTIDVFSFGSKYTDVNDMYVAHNIVLAVSVGDKVKPNDVICYNKDFFKYDSHSRQLDMIHGTMATVALLEEDGTLEDSCCISQELSNRLSTELVTTRAVILNSNSIVHSSVEVGNEVLATDYLIVFEDGEGMEIFDKYDEDTRYLLSKINRKTPKAKYTGTIVKIDAYYSCDINSMHPTLKKIIAPIVKNKKALSEYSKDSRQKNIYNESKPLPVGTKFKGVEFGEDTILLLYYIKRLVPHEGGDKLVIANQLKSTTMSVYPYTPVSESGRPIDVVFSSDRIAARVVLSPYYMGIVDRLLEKIEDDICDMYFDE